MDQKYACKNAVFIENHHIELYLQKPRLHSPCGFRTENIVCFVKSCVFFHPIFKDIMTYDLYTFLSNPDEINKGAAYKVKSVCY